MPHAMTTPRKAAKKRTERAGAARGAPERGETLGVKLGAKLAPGLAKKRDTAAKPPPPKGAAKQGRATPEAEEAAGATEARERLRFAQLMRGVERVRDGARRIPTTLGAPDAPPEEGAPGARDAAVDREADADRSARARLEAFVAEGIRFEVADDGESLEGRRLDVDPREIRKLRQLRYALDGTLDLHGLGAAEARARLE